jgi:hypothetical protein
VSTNEDDFEGNAPPVEPEDEEETNKQARRLEEEVRKRGNSGAMKEAREERLPPGMVIVERDFPKGHKLKDDE